MAESLVDYSSNREFSKPKDNKATTNTKRERNDQWKPQGSVGATATQKGKVKEPVTRDTMKCFTCDGPHWARDCPQRRLLNAQAVLEKHDDEEK